MNSEKPPSVTTVLATLGWNKGPLMAWANRCGLEGKKHWQVAGEAAQAGTVLHAMIDVYLKGRLFARGQYDQALVTQAEKSFQGFLTWQDLVGLKVRGTEINLTSSRYGYQGTLDCVGTLQGGLAVLDWKHSPRVYLEALIQLAAYGVLWSENFPAEPLSGGFHLLRIGSDGAFDHHRWAELPEAFAVFERLLEIYKLRPQLKGLLAS